MMEETLTAEQLETAALALAFASDMQAVDAGSLAPLTASHVVAWQEANKMEAAAFSLQQQTTGAMSCTAALVSDVDGLQFSRAPAASEQMLLVLPQARAALAAHDNLVIDLTDVQHDAQHEKRAVQCANRNAESYKLTPAILAQSQRLAHFTSPRSNPTDGSLITYAAFNAKYGSGAAAAWAQAGQHERRFAPDRRLYTEAEFEDYFHDSGWQWCRAFSQAQAPW
jgi:hypothetical protein